MFDHRAIARARADQAREALKRAEEVLARERRELSSAKADSAYSEEGRAALEDVIRLDAIRVQQLNQTVVAYETIAEGKRVFT